MELTPEQIEAINQEKEELLKEEKNNEVVAYKSVEHLPISNEINSAMSELYASAVEKNKDKIEALTESVVTSEIEIRNEQVQGQKEVMKSQIGKTVAQAQTEEDNAKHERAKTILKAQGLTKQLPKAFRVTALILGYPFFILYLITLGWLIEFLTFAITGFITMVADCAERFVELNAKMVENSNNKDFKLGKAIIGIFKWLLIVGAVVAVVILLINK